LLYYWLLFFYFAVGALIAPATKDYQKPRRTTPLLIFGALITACLIGLRYRVGADWDTYVFIFSHAGSLDFWRSLQIGDPGYQALNWIVYNAGGDIWEVNLLCAAIFTWGLVRFCVAQENPWLALLVSIPYTVIVVAMGYTRQAVALGILMAGLASYLRGGGPIRFVMYVLVAVLFHKTAVVVVPLIAIGESRNKLLSFLNFLFVLSMGILLYDVFFGNAMDRFVQNYIQQEYSSQGAAIRVAMNLVAAALLFTMRHRLGFNERAYKLWRNFALASIGMLVLLFTLPSSTAVDRMSLYLLPLQIAVLASLPKGTKSEFGGSLAVVGYMAAVQFVWLTFAVHANYWVPYRFFPI